MKKQGSGWKGESRRHSLARKGIKTASGVSPHNHLKPAFDGSVVDRVKELMQNENIDPEYASPNFVNDFANNHGISLTSEEVVEISDTYNPKIEYTLETVDGKIKGIVKFNSLWSEYQVYIDGSLYGSFQNKDEAIKFLEHGGFKASGWHQKLRSLYGSKEEWVSYAEMYGLHRKLGYDTPEDAWDDNPHIQGGVDPAEYGIYVPKKKKMKSSGKHKITQSKLDTLITEANTKYGRKYSIGGAYGNYELWENGERLEVGSKKDIYEFLIKHRFQEKKKATPDFRNETTYRGYNIVKLFPSGYYEYYSDKKQRFIKSNDLDRIKEYIRKEKGLQ